MSGAEFPILITDIREGKDAYNLWGIITLKSKEIMKLVYLIIDTWGLYIQSGKQIQNELPWIFISP